MFKKIFKIFFILLFLLTFLPKNIYANDVNLTLFYSNGCPHCTKEKEFLAKLEQKYDWLKITQYEVTKAQNAQLFQAVGKNLDIKTTGVPVTIFCDQHFVGYQDDGGGDQVIEDMLLECQNRTDCIDVVADIIAQNNFNLEPGKTPKPQPTTQPENSVDQNTCLHDDPNCDCLAEDTEKGKLEKLMERSINVPILGAKQFKDFSLPALTFFVALLDGFNPCAMWVLLFLISMLIGMKDKKRMWILGSAFIVASAFVYFLFLSAWLNMFLFIGFIKPVQIGIGLFALGAAIYYLYDFYTNKDGACKVTGNEKRQKIFEKIKKITQKENLFIALVGIIILAFAVNLVELLCSAGLPAIYTQVLSLSNLPTYQYYLYLAEYIIIFMIDDLIIFFVAMFTFHTTGISSKYSRYSHLIGGILMLAIGLAMIFKPELLMFG